MPINRQRKTPLAKAKAKAWTAFSLYIRTRDCLKYDPVNMKAKCVTCDYVYPLKSLQAGHFISGRNNGVLFQEKGVHAQCNACNKYKKGNTVVYWLFMEKTYGRPIIDRLIGESNQTVKYKVWDYEEIEQKFKRKLEKLNG